jgi:circadian clock protein KaiB
VFETNTVGKVVSAMEPMGQGGGRPGALVELCLFVAGDTGSSARARRQLERFRAELADADWRVAVVDVVERPDLAEQAGIVATPVLIRLAPLPRRSVIGDFGDFQAVADVLGVGGDRGEASETRGG